MSKNSKNKRAQKKSKQQKRKNKQNEQTQKEKLALAKRALLDSQRNSAEFECSSCSTHFLVPQPNLESVRNLATSCPRCKSKYVKWLNYKDFEVDPDNYNDEDTIDLIPYGG